MQYKTAFLYLLKKIKSLLKIRFLFKRGALIRCRALIRGNPVVTREILFGSSELNWFRD